MSFRGGRPFNRGCSNSSGPPRNDGSSWNQNSGSPRGRGNNQHINRGGQYQYGPPPPQGNPGYQGPPPCWPQGGQHPQLQNQYQTPAGAPNYPPPNFGPPQGPPQYPPMGGPPPQQQANQPPPGPFQPPPNTNYGSTPQDYDGRVPPTDPTLFGDVDLRSAPPQQDNQSSYSNDYDSRKFTDQSGAYQQQDGSNNSSQYNQRDGRSWNDGREYSQDSYQQDRRGQNDSRNRDWRQDSSRDRRGGFNKPYRDRDPDRPNRDDSRDRSRYDDRRNNRGRNRSRERDRDRGEDRDRPGSSRRYGDRGDSRRRDNDRSRDDNPRSSEGGSSKSRDNRNRDDSRRNGKGSRGRDESRDSRSESRDRRSDTRDRKRDGNRDNRQRDRKGNDDRDRSPAGDSRKPWKRPRSESPDMESFFKEVPKQEDEDEDLDIAIPDWVRSSPADVYFKRDQKTGNMMSTPKQQALENKFMNEIVKHAERVRASKPPVEKPERPEPKFHHHHHHNHGDESASDSGSSDSDSADDEAIEEEIKQQAEWVQEMERKKGHPERLHPELWFNEEGEMNAGPVCKCSIKARRTGIRHDIYPGAKPVPKCQGNTNNMDKLFHYRITISPHTNFLTKNPTVIEHDSHEYLFEGFSLFSHHKLENVPVCKFIRFNIEYKIHWFEEDFPENFSVSSLDLFTDYVFNEILELYDVSWGILEDGCRLYHLMPRFARSLPDNGKELLSINEVLNYLLKSYKPLIDLVDLNTLLGLPDNEWRDYVDEVRGMIATYPGMRPSSLRIDQLDRTQMTADVITYPLIVHFGFRPAQLSFVGDTQYQKLWKQYIKLKHLIYNKPKVTAQQKEELRMKEETLQNMRTKGTMKREVTVELSSEGYIRTGIKSDICQHALLIPVLIGHLRFHRCLNVLEDVIEYKFSDRYLLQLALTHPSFRLNFGTNSDHARNSLFNCGIRQVEYGDRKVLFVHTRKRGINILFNIMSQLGRRHETASEINHYERLEYLGDAVVEFITSVHLYYMFPNLEEGGMAIYRTAIVQNQNLAILAQKLRLHEFLLYAHGPDLCHESEIKHAMANCFEALFGAVFLDGGIDTADRIFSKTIFGEDDGLFDIWANLPKHPLQVEEPAGDRHWIEKSPVLQRMREFEEDIGVEFTHVRLLARAFTTRSVKYNNLTLGHNQRLEFLGDTVMQLIVSRKLYLHFPDHHEGHLSLLRSSLVNNWTQSVVCDDLGMMKYVIRAEKDPEEKESQTRTILVKHKEKADLLEAFLGALYVDKGLDYIQVFCDVCFFPRLKQFIMNQEWNDPKSQLQQCCLTLRELNGEEPDIPIYKVIDSAGPTNSIVYTVAVYFRDERLATGCGHSIQNAEMNAATKALEERYDMFPFLEHQKRRLEKKFSRKFGANWKDNLSSNSLTPANTFKHINDSPRGSAKKSK